MIEDLRSLPGMLASALLAGAGVLSFVVPYWSIRSGGVSWDERLFILMNKGSGSHTAAARMVAAVTTPIALAILVVIAALAVHRTNGSAAVIVAAVAAGLGWASANGAKLLIDRPRPYVSLADAILRQDPARGTSFPSSHVAIVTATVIAMSPLLPRPWRLVGIGVIALVAWSRLYFGVHHPLDLVGGIGMGLVSAAVTWIVVGAIARAW